jgi:8-oxo-dGTP pyrophosphatase MutT (NUDIX family)
MSITQQTTKEIIDQSLCSEAVYQKYKDRLELDNLTRDEDNKSHLCVYFLPYNPNTKQIFIIHHKKSGFWLSPGGHIDKGESILDALKREIKEELGFDYAPSENFKPFLLTITPIENSVQPCKEHFDVWFRVETDGNNFNVDPKEFLATKWVTIDEARKIMLDPANIEMLNKMESFLI